MGIHDLDPQAFSSFLKSAGIFPLAQNIQTLKGGANNRVYRINFVDRAPLVLKSYFQHPEDPRPRLKAEFEFLSFAWDQGIRQIPEPIYQNFSSNLALYGYIDAGLANVSHANQSFVESSVQLLNQLNRNKEKGTHLLDASEACFQTIHYVETVERKLNLLFHTPEETDLEKKFHSFLRKELIPQWETIKQEACKTALHTINPEEDDLILTPSDLGLHNVLASSEGKHYFIDFEYAGWDDPAKTICDFFLQPKIPIPFSFFPDFSKRVAALAENPEKTLERTLKMLPICKIKWCCIILNVFLRIGKNRREFAENDQAHALEKQLHLASECLNKQF